MKSGIFQFDDSSFRQQNRGRNYEGKAFFILKYVFATFIFFLLINLNASYVQASDLMLIAHRGYHTQAPENTLASFRNAAQAGFKWVEIDVRETKDGEFVILHNSTVDAMTNGSGAVSQLTLRRIKSFRIDSGKGNPRVRTYRIPTLQQALSVCRSCSLGAVVHTVGVRNYRKLVSNCNSSGIKIIYQVNNGGQARKIRSYNPKATLMAANYGEKSSSTLAMYQGIRLDWVNLKYSAATSGAFSRVSGKHASVCVWANDNLTNALLFYQKGARAFITDEITPGRWEQFMTPRLSLPTTLTGVFQKRRQQLTVSWKPTNGVKGYQLQWSSSSSFANAKTLNVYGKTTAQIKCSSGRACFIRIRTFKRYGGRTWYSNWSRAVKQNVR